MSSDPRFALQLRVFGAALLGRADFTAELCEQPTLPSVHRWQDRHECDLAAGCVRDLLGDYPVPRYWALPGVVKMLYDKDLHASPQLA